MNCQVTLNMKRDKNPPVGRTGGQHTREDIIGETSLFNISLLSHLSKVNDVSDYRLKGFKLVFCKFLRKGEYFIC